MSANHSSNPSRKAKRNKQLHQANLFLEYLCNFITHINELCVILNQHTAKKQTNELFKKYHS